MERRGRKECVSEARGSRRGKTDAAAPDEENPRLKLSPLFLSLFRSREKKP
jgi:hypothetical protein